MTVSLTRTVTGTEPSRPMSFPEYIRSRRMTDTVQGDFTEQAKKDLFLPSATCWKELREYLDSHGFGVTADMYLGARLVWGQYRARFPKWLCDMKE